MSMDERMMEAIREDMAIDLRDRFAMAALTGMLAKIDDTVAEDDYAAAAYSFADAMLKARAK